MVANSLFNIYGTCHLTGTDTAIPSLHTTYLFNLEDAISQPPIIVHENNVSISLKVSLAMMLLNFV